MPGNKKTLAERLAEALKPQDDLSPVSESGVVAEGGAAGSLFPGASTLKPEVGDDILLKQLKRSFGEFRQLVVQSAGGDRGARKAVARRIKSFAAVATGTPSRAVKLQPRALTLIRRMLERQVKSGVAATDLGLLATSSAVSSAKLGAKLTTNRIGRAFGKMAVLRADRIAPELVSAAGEASVGSKLGSFLKGVGGTVARGLPTVGGAVLGFTLAETLADKALKPERQRALLKRIRQGIEVAPGQLVTPQEFEELLTPQQQQDLLRQLRQDAQIRGAREASLLSNLASFDPNILTQIGAQRAAKEFVPQVNGSLALSVPRF